MEPIIIITGQTGTGKTALALKLAKENKGELINADSRQVYKYLDIVTGKDLPQNTKYQIQNTNHFNIGYYILNGTKIWLYDAVDPKEYFSSYDFVTLARRVIDEIQSRGKIPIVIGGSYFYIKHLIYGFETEKIPPDWKLREELNIQSTMELQKRLKIIDHHSFNQMNSSDQQNPHRLIRKIEIAMQKKKNRQIQFRGYLTSGVNQLQIEKFIGLRFADKQKITYVIKKRVDERLKNGAVEEVKTLLEQGYKKNNPGLQTIGYKQLIDYIEGEKTKHEAIDEWILREIQYARRQYTFMKKDKNIIWKDV